MTVPQLRERYAEVFGEQTRSGNKDFLIKRISWRVQANAYGGLTERALKRAMEIANDADLRVRWPKDLAPVSLTRPAAARQDGRTTVVPAPIRTTQSRRKVGTPRSGTIIARRYKDQTIAVKVLDDGFEWRGEVFKSLSAVAKAVTGSHWNGNIFFGLSGRSRARENTA